MTGYRESERLAVCTRTTPNMIVPFVMLECSGFSDRNGPDAWPAPGSAGTQQPIPDRPDSDGRLVFEKLHPAGNVRSTKDGSAIRFIQ
jgi:hypothetical protein